MGLELKISGSTLQDCLNMIVCTDNVKQSQTVRRIEGLTSHYTLIPVHRTARQQAMPDTF